jgi:flagellar basal body P-ring formation protein FlgA
MHPHHVIPALLLALCCAGVGAQAPAPDAGQDVRLFGQRWAESAVPHGAAAGAGALRMEVQVGELDTRLQLAPCLRIEPYVPAGMRLWGNTRLGLRCAEGAVRWNVFLPVTVRAWGPAWVLKQPVAAGAVLSEADAVRAEVDWAAQASPVIQDPAQWVGQAASAPLAAGQPLRQAMVKPAQAFPAGASVRIVVEGPGFGITTDGFAVNPGYVGQSTRIRTETGRIVGATVLDGRTVRLDL